MSRSRAHDPRRLDVVAAAADGLVLEGRWPVAALERLRCDPAEPPADDGEAVVWSARFDQRVEAGGPAQVWLRLHACARVQCQCQRCLQPMLVDLQVDRALRFAATEEEAAALDARSEDDVLALSRAFDLQALVEDELLLALPLVPRHERCPLPLHGAQAAEEVVADSPFAALAALKRPREH